jgi:hypothetical protein
MSGAIRPLPKYAFMAWCSFKAQGQLYLNIVARCEVFIVVGLLGCDAV